MGENTYVREKERWNDEEVRDYIEKMVSDSISHLENLNTMSTGAKYEQYRVKAINSYFRNAPKFLKIKKIIDNFDKQDDVDDRDEDVEPEEEVEVHFGD